MISGRLGIWFWGLVLFVLLSVCPVVPVVLSGSHANQGEMFWELTMKIKVARTERLGDA